MSGYSNDKDSYTNCKNCKTTHCCFFLELYINTRDKENIYNAVNNNEKIFKKCYYEEIKKKINNNVIKPINNGNIYILLPDKTKDGIERHRGILAHPCEFLDTTNHLCMIYPVRPEICRKWNCNGATEPVSIDFDLGL